MTYTPEKKSRRLKKGPYLLGVDIGSSACKACVTDMQGSIVGAGNREYPTSASEMDRAEQDPDHWYGAFIASAKQSLKEAGLAGNDLAAVSVCGPAHNAVLLGRDNRVLRPTILWWDTRNIEQSNWLQKNHGEEIFRTTHQRVHSSWTLAQLLWIRENETQIFDRIRKILIGKDYIVYRLTGVWGTDWYDAMGTQLLEAKSRKWAENICGILGLASNRLPPIKNPMEIAGTVHAAASRETGLPEGLPVAVGSGDSVVEAFGVSAIHEGDCLVKLATSGTVSVVSGKQIPNRKTMSYFHVLPELFYTIAATNSGASSLQWFDRAFDTAADKSYDSIEKRATGVSPGCGGLMFHPYIRGERSPYWDPLLKGDFIGISHNHRLEHFTRAVLEGVAFSLRDCAELFVTMEIPLRRAMLVGGGARIGLWRQIVADVLNMELMMPDVPSVYITTFGAAKLAGYATGIYHEDRTPSIEPDSRTGIIRPESHNVRRYEQLFPIYRETVARLQPIYEKLSSVYQ
jgi:xylulokinase